MNNLRRTFALKTFAAVKGDSLFGLSDCAPDSESTKSV